MAATLALCGYTLAALLFGVLALSPARDGCAGLPRRSYAVALGLTALWALAVAGIGSDDLGTRAVGGARDLAWLFLMLIAARRAGGAGRGAVLGVYAAVAFTVVARVGVSVIAWGPQFTVEPVMLATTRLSLGMMAAAGALFLTYRLSTVAQGGARLTLAGVAAIWTTSLVVSAAGYAGLAGQGAVHAFAGVALVGIATLLAAAAGRRGDWPVRISRTVAVRSLTALALALYVAAVALVAVAIGAVAGTHARLLQTALVFGAATTLLAIASTPWLRAWAQVTLSKHLFRHRYDYRAEWLRFTETLGQPGEGAAPLDERVVKAVADLTCSPAGVLLVSDGPGLGVGTAWRWEVKELPAGPEDAALADRLAASPRIVELDAVRAGRDEATAAVVPQWMLDRREAWVLVPLPHAGTLAGAILLARPPVDRPLDWEDFDLLRLAARQVASYLAEQRAQAALADATRFDEFNRRFAFIMHDIKNLVSQLTLVARNAERHADNPAFRADMVATLKDSADRMNALLARLSQHHGARGEELRAVEPEALAERVARARRAVHPVVTHGSAPPVLADPIALEQLLGHLLQNAIEASPPAEPVTLAVGVEGSRIAIDVIDRGCGMSPAFVRDRLFRPFVSTKPGGFGIGVFEARQLAEAMNGSVEVASREGEGTRFRVLLPTAVAVAVELERAA